MFLSAIPSPEGGMNRQNWKERTVQAEFAMWAARFGMQEPVFEDRLWAFASVYQHVLDVILTPVDEWEDLSGMSQSWKMFVAPHRFPSRLQIQARTSPDAEWETVFEERSETAMWHAEIFDTERLRSAIFRWSWPNFVRSYHNACEAFANLLFAERADVQAMRCRFQTGASPSPEEVREGRIPKKTWGNQWVVGRDGYTGTSPPRVENGAPEAGTNDGTNDGTSDDARVLP
jgi:hypothetical protein